MEKLRSALWAILIGSISVFLIVFGCAFLNNYRHITAVGPILGAIIGSAIYGLRHAK